MSDAVFRAILDLNSFEGSSQAVRTAFPQRIPSFSDLFRARQACRRFFEAFLPLTFRTRKRHKGHGRACGPSIAPRQ